MCKTTTLAMGYINDQDTLLILLVEPEEAPPEVWVIWPDRTPAIYHPAALAIGCPDPFTTTILAEARDELAMIMAGRDVLAEAERALIP